MSLAALLVAPNFLVACDGGRAKGREVLLQTTLPSSAVDGSASIHAH